MLALSRRRKKPETSDEPGAISAYSEPMTMPPIRLETNTASARPGYAAMRLGGDDRELGDVTVVVDPTVSEDLEVDRLHDAAASGVPDDLAGSTGEFARRGDA